MADAEAHIRSAIKKALALPTVPAVALAILRMSHDPRTSIEKLAETMAKDPALAAKTLRFANSSYYGASRPILSLPQALVRIGVRRARMLALSFSLIGARSRAGADGFNFTGFWHRSLTTSVVARRIALRSVRGLTEQAFIGALLADIGWPVLAAAFPQQYRGIEAMVATSQRDLVDVERGVLGTEHTRAAALVLEAWHLPKALVDAVGAHHDLDRLDRDCEAFNVAAVILTASDVADTILRGVDRDRVKRMAATFRDCFSFGGDQIDLLLRGLGREVRTVGAMLDVRLPPVDQMQEEAKGEMLKLALNESDRDLVAETA